MEPQSIDNLRGEVTFRRKLARQHVTGETLLPDYYGKEEHDMILAERVETTVQDVGRLEKRGKLSPFIELGAERCQRSLVLTNDFNAQGFSVDISFDQLKTAEHFARVLGRPKLPLRVCCDVNRLPFRSHSFAFAFCYEFLHHFPSPVPILREAHRILSDGMFFFSEEPFKRPKVILYRQRHKMYSKSALRKSKAMQFIEKFLSEEYCDEREHGILENSDIPLKEWIAAASIFNEKEVCISSLGNKICSKLGDRVRIRNLPNMLLGGGISGVCMKKDLRPLVEPDDLLNLLLCPDCMAKAEYQEAGQPSLVRAASRLECSVCQSTFPVVDGVMFLLPKGLFRELYPDFAG